MRGLVAVLLICGCEWRTSGEERSDAGIPHVPDGGYTNEEILELGLGPIGRCPDNNWPGDSTYDACLPACENYDELMFGVTPPCYPDVPYNDIAHGNGQEECNRPGLEYSWGVVVLSNGVRICCHATDDFSFCRETPVPMPPPFVDAGLD